MQSLRFSKPQLVIYFIAFEFVTTACYYNEAQQLELTSSNSFSSFLFLQSELTHFLDGGAAKTEERLKLEAFFLDDFVAKVRIIIFYILF
jgi:hypothetical protein